MYHARAQEFSPSEEDWKEWLGGLPDKIRAHTEQIGFEQGKRIFPFTRYVMEKNDVGMDEYVRQRMDAQDYQEYMSLLKVGKKNL